jgi:hypothetical protein
MSRAKLACVVCAATALLSACGTVSVKPTSTTNRMAARGKVDDPRTNHPNHVQCLQGAKLPVREIGATDLEIGTAPNLIRVHFDSTPGASEADQLDGHVQAAEVIGSALVYPGSAPDGELAIVEGCMSQGVKG